ncbi:MAG: carboxypeptidase-like regulatory domain-containing protein, partial [Vicinamibacterales bacterium]|nr:carboxypeptidase-like regulatory domain-containing protein [Vicinamibacterales bacterium]
MCGSRLIRRIIPLALVALVWAGLCAPAHAQATRGTVLGTITDQIGAAMPGVTVVATETRTNLSYDTVTNATGNFTFPNIPDGIYNIKAELQGFKTVVREAIRLAVNTSIRVDLALPVGDLAETVTVSGVTPLLQTDRTDTGRVLESVQVASMPLGFNRNFQGLMATVPGSTRPRREHSEFFNPQDSLRMEVNGQSGLANNVQIEGLDNNQRTGLLTILIPPAEAIDTVSISTSNYDAEYGRAAGAVSSVTLKSGTNTLKGSVFWFGNTEKTNALPASTYFSSVRTKPPTTYNQFGFTLGGPIKKNTFFFFGDYQRTQDKLGAVQRYVVPTAEFRRGDFSAAPTAVYDPLTGNAAGVGRTQFPNNQIPSNRISPIALNILSKIPMPNLAGVALGVANYQVNSVRDKTTDSFDTKLNYAVNDSNQLSVRLSYQKPTVIQLPAEGYGEWGGPLGSGFMATGTNLTYSTGVNWTRTFTNTLVLEVRGGTSYYHNEALPIGYGQTFAEQLGISGTNLDAWTSGAPRIQINNGYSNPVMGYSASLPWDRWERTWQFAATATKVWGNHTTKFGADFRRSSDMLLQTQDAGGPRGYFVYSGAQTGSPANTAANSGIANAFASFLLDAPSSVQRDLKVLDNPGTKHWSIFGFVHDKWQLSQNLTLDLGLRWEYYDPLSSLAGRGGLSNFDPATNSLIPFEAQFQFLHSLQNYFLTNELLAPGHVM